MAVLTELGWPGFADLTLAGLLFLCCAAFVAGGVDAVVGGGGLIQLPALLLLMPGGEAIFSLATNKVASIAGTGAAAVGYAKHTRIDWSAAVPMALFALVGSLSGAVFADLLPSHVLNIIVLCALVLVGLYTWFSPDLGSTENHRFSRRQQLLVMFTGGVVLGFWDGIAGPGTGSFLVFLLVGLVGYVFVNASATAKIVNIATNFGALLFFVPAGKVLWGVGLCMALSNAAGSYLGAWVATRRGSRFVRKMFLVVVVGLVVSLGWKLALT